MIWRKSIFEGTVLLPFVVQSCNVLMARTIATTAMFVSQRQCWYPYLHGTSYTDESVETLIGILKQKCFMGKVSRPGQWS